MATHIDSTLEPGLNEVAEALRGSGGAATTAGLQRAHAATLAAVRAQAGRAPARVTPLRRGRMVGFLLAAAAAAAVVLAVQPALVVRPVQAALGLSGSGTSVKAEGRLAAISADDALASGTAKGEQRSDRTRFGVEVEDVASPPGTYAVRLLRDGSPVPGSEALTMAVDSFGAGDLNLDSRDGDAPPVAQAGDIVEVVSPDGVIILRGALALK